MTLVSTSAAAVQFPIARLALFPAWFLEAPSANALSQAAEFLRKHGAPPDPLKVWRRHEYRHRDQSTQLVHYVITGRRYLFAARAAGFTHLPVTFHRSRSSEEVECEFLFDCLTQDDLSPAGRGLGHDRLVTLGLHPRQYALSRTRTDPSMVTHLRRFVLLPQRVQWLIQGGALGYQHARALHPFLPWPRMVTRLALATVEYHWRAADLRGLTPATFGLVPGQPEPAEWPDPGIPPFGPAWRPRRIRGWVVKEMTRWVECGRFDTSLASVAAQMIAEAGIDAALEIVGHYASHLEEEAMQLASQVEEELDLRDDGLRDGPARTEAIVYVWSRWLSALGATDPALAWSIGAEAYLRWDGPVGASVWLPPSLGAPLPSSLTRAAR